ncbi:prolyl oligopeptidase family serine peptidase [Caulobacter sp. 17J65-9]|uniref:prolyl oligopeptidase family serine peptidase n=1 Tax=Caulobacter sp. 17J65-9 TaxID=2709382 RepID=UPI0013C90282|nr:prolyl oligopeptidase family serine peptidase [Caulobacter sp. 17J65-9]NEX92413.1 S9 family peptidase [Caulobacter sp. 17J65-9]
MRLLLSVCAAALLAAGAANAQTAPAAAASAPAASATDPFQWLEDVNGARSMEWVKAQNAKAKATLEGDARFEEFRKEGLAIFTAQDRIPYPSFRAGAVDNLWQDAERPHGVWRKASVESYRTAEPAWETVLDIDALAKAEGRDWFLKGSICLSPDETRCLLRLSDGGKDAVTLREFDTKTKTFVDGGFTLSEGKQYAEWIDADTLVVGRDWGAGSLSESGYPIVLKTLKRGQGVDQAKEIYRGEAKDVWVQPFALRDADGKLQALMIDHGLTFFEKEYLLVTDKGAVKLPFPKKASIQSLVNGQVVFTVEEDWNGFKAGDLLAYDLAALKRDPAKAKATLIYSPKPNQAVEGVASTRDRLVVTGLEDVTGFVDVYGYAKGKWTAKRLNMPANSSINIVDTSKSSNRLFLTTQGFLDPTTLVLADASTGSVEKVKALPARFDASKDTVEQFWATSNDGTKIPYFVVHRKDIKLDGSTPTLMYGYGGFQLSKPPVYLPEVGKLWLERGGAYVIANIRGGGEFGPAWHDAVLKANRQKAFDDFASVGQDLISRKITSARHLGIYGRSNGGVLTTVSMTQHPELFNAVVVESPLIDMMRYHKLSAGASWVGEYGNPDIPEEAAYIAKYSGYQNLRPGVTYPKAYITTNTKDDRVHPGHARKYAAKLEAMGVPYIYFEDDFGGHSYDADPTANAARWARHYVYLSQQLMD